MRQHPTSSPFGEEDGGVVDDRSRFTVTKLILGDDEPREEYYIQVIISRKAAALLVAFFTVLVSLVEVGTRYFFSV